MDEGADRGRAFHGIWQPHVQRELGALADGPGEEEQTDPEEGPRPDRLGLVEDAGELQRPGRDEHEEHAEREAEIAHAVDEEGLLARLAGALPVEPEADQQVRAQPDALPAEEEQEEVVGEDQRVHREHEEVQVGEEPVVAAVAAHVADRVVVRQHADDADDEQHDAGEGVDLEPPRHVVASRDDPRERVPDERFVLMLEHPREGVDGQRGCDGDQSHGYDVRLAPHALAEEQRDDEAGQRQQHDEDDGDLHGVGGFHACISPSSRRSGRSRRSASPGSWR